MLSSKQIDRMLDAIIAREGGYVNHPSDPGGETKYGISRRAHPGVDIRNLTLDGARDIYRSHYVKPYRIAEIHNDRLAEWILDWVVHSGSSAIRTIQRELKITVDGRVGRETLVALTGIEDPRDVLRWRLKFLVGLTKHPFIKGWVNRLLELGL